jgi:hypothetical protein
MWTSHTINGVEVAKCARCGGNASSKLVGTEEPCAGKCARTIRTVIETSGKIDPSFRRTANGSYRLDIEGAL